MTSMWPPPTDTIPRVLSRSRPNPFSVESRFSVKLDDGVDADVSVFDIAAGVRCAPCSADASNAGTTELAWNGQRDDGRRAEAGIYFYRLTTCRTRMVDTTGAAATTLIGSAGAVRGSRAAPGVPEPMTDAELVARAVAGDAGAFAELVGPASRRVPALCGARARRPDGGGGRGAGNDAESVPLARALSGAPAVPRVAVPDPRQPVPDRGRAPGAALGPCGAGRRPSASPATARPRSNCARVSSRALGGLDAAHREAFLLKLGEGLEYEEIARITGASIPALKMRVKRAPRSGARAMEGDGERWSTMIGGKPVSATRTGARSPARSGSGRARARASEARSRDGHSRRSLAWWMDASASGPGRWSRRRACSRCRRSAPWAARGGRSRGGPAATPAAPSAAIAHEPQTDVTFVFRAPGASTVALVGDFNGWDPEATPLRRVDAGRRVDHRGPAPERTPRLRLRHRRPRMGARSRGAARARGDVRPAQLGARGRRGGAL